ncbi:MAG: zinc-dependent alcohol dehydrogenase family protein [Planctomycetaceae bacterium]|nr:zinc-dependent alcohol dehydrogenase family protein [Planctomycetaceae bacterium]
MQAARFDACGIPAEVVSVSDITRPIPGKGEVLVRMLASPINPSDLSFIEGSYGQQPELPATPGFEGVGIVESSGGGLLGSFLTGKRVTVANREGGNWAEYAVISAKQAIPLPESLTLEQAASFFVNPASVVAMVEKIHQVRRGEWLLQSAANSSLGRMVIRLGRQCGIRTLNVVRRSEQIDQLKSLGADEVLVFDAAADDPEMFVSKVHQLTNGGVRCAIDPVGGIVGSTLARCLNNRGRLLVFGSLTGEPLTIFPRTLIAPRAQIEGFWLGPWMLSQSLPRKLRLMRRISHLINAGILTTEVCESFPLSRVSEAIAVATQPAREGKVLLRIGDAGR